MYAEILVVTLKYGLTSNYERRRKAQKPVRKIKSDWRNE